MPKTTCVARALLPITISLAFKNQSSLKLRVESINIRKRTGKEEHRVGALTKPTMTRSNHPLLLLGICALSASNVVALSNDIQGPHRLFRDGMLRKSAMNTEESIESDEKAISNDADAVLQFETGTADIRTIDDSGDDGEDASRDGSMEDVVETPDDLNEWFDYNRQKSDDELLSMDTGGVDDIEFQECVEVKVCPDPACAEMEEVVVEDPTLDRHKILLRRHLEAKAHKALKDDHTYLAKGGKAEITAYALPNAELPKPVSADKIIGDVIITSKKPKSAKTTPPDSQIPPTVSSESTAGDTATIVLPSTSLSTKSGKVSKAAKGCKSGKGSFAT
ncbi:hypothetical protein ACHAXA_008116 [Cyclostephanos tholiformis]|uniref:Uncharacterized protein n=1 Tax=Cyclostephanos tholiformis TaxID=382380 RepID=A0ABD3SEW3_9STRA